MDVKKITSKYDNDPLRLMDILIEIQERERCIPKQAISDLGTALGISSTVVEETLSFYHFFTRKPAGAYTVYLNNSAVAEMCGAGEIGKVFEKEAGIKFGGVTADGKIGLFKTADIGMNDQEPAALINGQVFTSLTPAKVKTLVAAMKAGKPASQMSAEKGDGMNASPLLNSMVKNKIRKPGPVIFDEYQRGSAVRRAVEQSPDEVIWEIKKSNIRGRGGAGFPTGMKWEFCRKAQGTVHYVLCNADEGEPGTFKDRVILTERPHLMFDGMIVAGYAIGATAGILYLRGEYAYMKNYLESILAGYRANNLLGKNIAGKNGFDFDIRIQLGAGAYVCGEESALIESAEGKRGEPRNRPPFPVEKGYCNQPTVVNNVETFCTAARTIIKGHEWIRAMGTDQTAGTKLLSVSGDCDKPGIYEVTWGATIADVIALAGGRNVQAVQVGGPSGSCVAPKEFNRKICYGDIATGGSFIIIGAHRNLFDMVKNFAAFFADESCGACIPCRAGNKLIQNKLNKIFSGHGVQADLDELQAIGGVMKAASRCGLGQTASNPIVTSMAGFPALYDAIIQKDRDFDTEFDLAKAVDESCATVGRKPLLQ